MKKLTNRQKQAINTKLKILQVAIELSHQSNFEDLSVNDICKACDISVGAFYHHFASKKEIIMTGYKQIDLLLDETYDASRYPDFQSKIIALFREGGSLLEGLGVNIVCEAYRNQLLNHEEYTFSPDRPVYIEAKKIVDAAMEAEQLETEESADAVTRHLMRIVRGVIFEWCLNNGLSELKKSIEEDLTFYLKAICR